MDRSQPGTRLTGSPRAAYPNAPEVVQRLLGKTAVLPNGCYIWTGHVDPEGYARTRIEGRVTFVHRSVYATLVAPIPDGVQIDHVCHSSDTQCGGGSNCLHRRCINPDHLEAVTARENSLRANNSFVSINARKTHCNSGHEFTPQNTYVRTNGSRRCVTCQREWSRRAEAKRGARLRADAR